MDSRDPIYLDYNASTPVLPEVAEAVARSLREHFGNPSSQHVYGRRSREVIEQARGNVARFLGCANDEIYFTSGGTEANNLAIFGVARARETAGHLVTSQIEHPATAAPSRRLELEGWRVTRLPVDRSGRIVVSALAGALDQSPTLVTLMHANNETGVLQPVAEIARAAKSVGAVVHSDAAQSLGKVPVDVRDLGVDLLSVAGHKLYAPRGVGALYVRRGIRIAPVVLGAGHERGLRPGTENVAAIAGLGVACAALHRDLEALYGRMLSLRERLWERLQSGVAGIELNGLGAERLPNTLSVRFPGVRGSAVLEATPEIAASTGSACHDGHESASAILLAMGLDAESALGTVRLSLGRATTPDEVDRAAAALSRGFAVAAGAARSS